MAKNLGVYNIDLEIYNYECENNRCPTHIVLHPEDYIILIEELNIICGHSFVNIIDYRGLKPIRTLDIHQGEWYLL